MILIFLAFVFLAGAGLAALTRDFSTPVRTLALVAFCVVCAFSATGLAKRQKAYEVIHTPRFVPVPEAQLYRQSGRPE